MEYLDSAFFFEMEPVSEDFCMTSHSFLKEKGLEFVLEYLIVQPPTMHLVIFQKFLTSVSSKT
jgi:hypothetical protein